MSTAGERLFIVLGFMLQLGMLFAYGFGSNFFNANSQAATDLFFSQFLVEYILMAVFTLMGFGLLLSYIRNGAWSGMTLTLMVVAINIQLSLLMQKFWFSVFTQGFTEVTSANTTNNPNSLSFFIVQNGKNVQPNVINFRVTLMNSISLLVALTGFIGKIKIFQAFLTTVIFNIGWNLAFYCNIHINLTRSPEIATSLLSNIFLFDDFGTQNVYVFGSFFGLIVLLILNCTPSLKKSDHPSPARSNALMLAGTAFLFATFAMTGRTYTLDRSTFNQAKGFLNIIFALSASVVGTYIISALVRGGNVGFKQALLGTIAGGVIVGTVAESLQNIAASIAVGLFAGIVTGFWYSFVHPRINREKIIDSHGIFGTFLIISFIGSFVVAPTAIASYQRNSIQIDSGASVNKDAAILQLAYVGIAAGAALTTGLIAGLFGLICRSNSDEDFDDSAFFNKDDFGLYDANIRNENPERNHNFDSAQNLKAN